MTGFKLTTPQNQEIRFEYYLDSAPVTSAAFHNLLPFTRTFYHARLSGQEFWIADAPPLDIIQENASVFTQTGEAVFGPTQPARAKTANCMGIYYGEGKGLDAANIFARVINEDIEKLKSLGEQVWKSGAQELVFTAWE